MSMVQTTTEYSPSDNLHCPRCNASLPPHAMFCSSCGERIGKEKKGSAPERDDSDVATRYRITSLVRRHPYVSLFFATDSQQQRMVAIRDIDISSLDEEAQGKAVELVQEEYDLLRQQSIPHVMPVIDLQDSKNHLFTIAGQPLFGVGTSGEGQTGTRLRTLQDFLQSGRGLPTQQIALSWISHLCQSLESLHNHQIIIGDLDPHAIVLNGDDYQSQPILMVSWLPLRMRKLLPGIINGQGESARTLATSFSAPEILLEIVEPASDVYSLGAILYLLLTGTLPDELLQRTQRRLRSPRELNPRINSSVDEIIMRALSLERSERFQSAKALAEALSSRRISQSLKAQVVPPRPAANDIDARRIERIVNIDTINITPLPEANFVLWEGARTQTNGPAPTVEGTLEQLPAGEDSSPGRSELLSTHPGSAAARDGHENTALPLAERFKQQFSGMLPAIPRLSRQITGVLPAIGRGPQPKAGHDRETTSGVPTEEPKSADIDTSLLKQIQRIVLGEQQHTTTAAATIETPLRVQPKQDYNIRIRLLGRDEPAAGDHEDLDGMKKGRQSTGLSGHAHGDLIYVEVRSALHQSYIYIVQQAAVDIPALGYVAEIVIPMQPFGSASDGRHERLHVFFMDEMRRPLYEKPFVIEIFVSHLVQPGREGHHVLPIPL